MIGSTIGSYRITKLLGEGGMGAVYQATDNIEREVAIKALRPQLTHDESRLERFRSEAIALGRLHHPNITSLFHLLEENDTFYMVMEFVEGQTLEDLIRRHGALPPRLALDILIDGLHGFEHAHSRGVIHRDIKASNLMLSAEGTTKIMDFGIARMDGSARLTKNGQQIGTLEYMSPEQVRGGELDARSDIYSLGILLFELLTGRVPFTDDNDFDLMRAHLEKAPPSVRYLVPSLPPLLDAVIAKALAKEPEARFENVAKLRSALEVIADGLPVTPTSSAVMAVPQGNSTRTTLVDTPHERYATMELDDRYGTRLQGTPLPVVSPPVIPPVAPVAASAPAVPASAPKAKGQRGMFPMLAALGGIALLLIALAVWAMFRPTPKNQVKPQQAPVPRASNSQRPRSTAGFTQVERSGGAIKSPASRPRVRRARQRVRSAEKPKRRVVRGVAPRRSSRTSQAKMAKRPQRRQLVRGGTSSGGEKAALRAIIKGQ